MRAADVVEEIQLCHTVVFDLCCLMFNFMIVSIIIYIVGQFSFLPTLYLGAMQ